MRTSHSRGSMTLLSHWRKGRREYCPRTVLVGSTLSRLPFNGFAFEIYSGPEDLSFHERTIQIGRALLEVFTSYWATILRRTRSFPNWLSKKLRRQRLLFPLTLIITTLLCRGIFQSIECWWPLATCQAEVNHAKSRISVIIRNILMKWTWMRETTIVLINTAVEDVCRSFDQMYLRTRFKNYLLIVNFVHS